MSSKKTKKNEQDYSYGAIYKGNWWVDNGIAFISPLNQNCQLYFDFNLKGEIRGLHDSATFTIDVLKLDHKSLTNDRGVSINEFINGKSGSNPISKAKALRLIDQVFNFDNSGRLVEFCVAIKCALNKHIEKLDKIAQKKKFVLQNKKK